MRSFKEMRMSGRSALLVRFFVVATVALTGFAHQASAATSNNEGKSFRKIS